MKKTRCALCYAVLAVCFALLFAVSVGTGSAALSPHGYEVTVALAPKTADDQPGTLYEGHNYRLLGQAADRVLLMTYE